MTTERIPCPKCRSNNMPGQTHCWQCGASLPPPEALAPQPPFAPAAYPPAGYAAPPARKSPVVPLLVGVLLLAAVVGALFVAAASRRKPAGPADNLQAQIEALKKQQSDMMGQGAPGISDVNALDPDSTEARAQRKLDSLLEKQRSLMAPGSGPGPIHLQGGGTLTREEWERARKAAERGVRRYQPP